MYAKPIALKLSDVATFDNGGDKWAKIKLNVGVIDMDVPRTINTRRGPTDMLNFKVTDESLSQATSSPSYYNVTAWGAAAVNSVKLGEAICIKATIDDFNGSRKLSINFAADPVTDSSFLDWWNVEKSSLVKEPRKVVSTLAEVRAEESEDGSIFFGHVVLSGYDNVVFGKGGRPRRALSLSDHTFRDVPATLFHSSCETELPLFVDGTPTVLRIEKGAAKINAFAATNGLVRKSLTINGAVEVVKPPPLDASANASAGVNADFVDWYASLSSTTTTASNKVSLRDILEMQLTSEAVKYVEVGEAVVIEIESTRSAGGSKEASNWSRNLVLCDKSCSDGFPLRLSNEATECDIAEGDVIRVGKIKVTFDTYRGKNAGFLASDVPKKVKSDEQNLKSVFNACKATRKRTAMDNLFSVKKVKVETSSPSSSSTNAAATGFTTTEFGTKIDSIDDISKLSVGSRFFIPRVECVKALGKVYLRGEKVEVLLKFRSGDASDASDASDAIDAIDNNTTICIKGGRVINSKCVEVGGQNIEFV